MKRLAKGRYIVAVSGGVDSLVLLDKLHREKDPALDIVVAHFNHGIRTDAGKDEQLVRNIAKKYGLNIEVGHGNLGENASEEQARKIRYEFLERARKKHKARAIVTAHHQDDLIETAFINILRGTGHKGIAAIALNPKVIRPLLDESKEDLLEYASQRKLEWREDVTNKDTKYLRNYIRHNVLPSLSSEGRQDIVNNIDKVTKLQPEINKLIAKLSQNIIVKDEINRSNFALLPVTISNEMLIEELRKRQVRDFDSKTIERVDLAIRTSLPNKKYNVQKNLWLEVKTKSARFTTIAKST